MSGSESAPKKVGTIKLCPPYLATWLLLLRNTETKYPPAHLIVPLSEVLNISTEELLGVEKAKNTLDPQFAALWRRLKVLETFSEKDRKAVLQFVEVIAERNKAQQAASNKPA